MDTVPSQRPVFTHELQFRSLFDPGRGYAFPCDAQGSVRLEALNEAMRASYLRAQARVGCELAAPVVVDLLEAPAAAARPGCAVGLSSRR